MNPESIIKKKIQLYVSESGSGTKNAKYYRIPLPSDSMDYNRETNAYKDCIRWYAKVSADRIYYATFNKLLADVAERVNFNNYTSPDSEHAKLTPSIQAIIPQLPKELINDGEISFSTNNYDSSIGYRVDVQKSLGDTKKNAPSYKTDSIFTNSGLVVSDSIADLATAIPSNWTIFDSISDVIKDLKDWFDSPDTVDRGILESVENIISNSYDGKVTFEERSMWRIVSGGSGIDHWSEMREYYSPSSIDSDIKRVNNIFNKIIVNNSTKLENDKLDLTFNANLNDPDNWAGRTIDEDSELLCAYKTTTGEFGVLRFPYKTIRANNNTLSIENFSKYALLRFVDKQYSVESEQSGGALNGSVVYLQPTSKFTKDLSDPLNRINYTATNREKVNIEDFADTLKEISKTSESLIDSPIEFNVENITNIKSLTLQNDVTMPTTKIHFNENDFSINFNILTFIDVLLKDGSAKSISTYQREVDFSSVANLGDVRSIIVHTIKPSGTTTVDGPRATCKLIITK